MPRIAMEVRQMVTPDTDSTPTSVYRYSDNDNLLLYVGITATGVRRNDQHNSKEWWPFVVSQQVEHYPSRVAAALIEGALIRQFRPPFNIHHNPDHEITRATYLAYRSSGITEDDRDAAYRRCGGIIPFEVKTYDHSTGTIQMFSPWQSAAVVLGVIVPKTLGFPILRKMKRVGRVTEIRRYGPLMSVQGRLNTSCKYDLTGRVVIGSMKMLGQKQFSIRYLQVTKTYAAITG